MTVIHTSLGSAGPYYGLPGSQEMGLLSVYPPEVGCVVSINDVDVGTSKLVLTNQALSTIARALAEGFAYKITTFIVGTSGFNPGNFAEALPVYHDTTIATPRYTGTVSDPEPADTAGTIYAYTCHIPSTYRGTVGEILLIAEVLTGPSAGMQVPFAIGHLPGMSKHRFSAVKLRCLVRG